MLRDERQHVKQDGPHHTDPGGDVNGLTTVFSFRCTSTPLTCKPWGNEVRVCPPRPYPLDVAAVGGGARQAQPYHVHEQPGDPQQVHGVTDEGGGDDVVDEERPVVRQEDAPEGSRSDFIDTVSWYI